MSDPPVWLTRGLEVADRVPECLSWCVRLPLLDAIEAKEMEPSLSLGAFERQSLLNRAGEAFMEGVLAAEREVCVFFTVFPR